MNHAMYADDICLMAPSPASLQELIDICYDFSVQNDLSSNSSQIVLYGVMQKSYKLPCLILCMGNLELKMLVTLTIWALLLVLTVDQKDGRDIFIHKI